MLSMFCEITLLDMEFLESNGRHFENVFQFSEWFFLSQSNTNIEATLYSTFDTTQVA
jgi:hypothetical protein